MVLATPIWPTYQPHEAKRLEASILKPHLHHISDSDAMASLQLPNLQTYTMVCVFVKTAAVACVVEAEAITTLLVASTRVIEEDPLHIWTRRAVVARAELAISTVSQHIHHV